MAARVVAHPNDFVDAENPTTMYYVKTQSLYVHLHRGFPTELSMLLACALVLAAYLAGSISSAVIVSHMMGLPDPRQEGSGNPGATNVLRLGGKKAAVITLCCDLLKGLLPVLLAKFVTDSSVVVSATAVAAFLGHLFPIFFRFKGGKGVATAFGATLGLVWPVALAMLGTWLFMAACFRYSSLSAITAALLAPVFTVILEPITAVILGVATMSVCVIWRHQSNIRNLLAGTEDKIGAKS